MARAIGDESVYGERAGRAEVYVIPSRSVSLSQADNGPVPNEVNPRKPRGQLDGPEIATATGRPNANARTGGQVNAQRVDERQPLFWLRSPPRAVRGSRVGA